ncbi:OmpA family protein [Shimia sp.]|uniref:OmpA family protein n=1 Tax=Shimia sp. TaxID=1954381 RepID=UPI003567A40E
MTRILLPALLTSAIALGACTSPEYVTGDQQSQDEYRNTRGGVILGGILGGVLGEVIADEPVAGVVIGAGVGALIGHDLDKQAAELRRDIDNRNVGIVNAGDRLIVTLPQDILFATDSFAVRSDLQDDLRVVAKSLNSYPGSVVQVIGHTDSTGSAAHNQRLSVRRAEAVADELMDAGVGFERIQTIGAGENQPVASNLTEEGKARNRRVEIVILPKA